MIPFNVAFLTGHEQVRIAESLAARQLTGDGPFTAAASTLLSSLVGGGRCLITTSCTHALEMAALLTGIGPGDEVLMPSFTFPSMANAVVLRGATPVFIDCRRDTFNIDETKLEEAITSRTRAIIVMHYGGVGCEMGTIQSLATKHDLIVIEDNAHGLGGSYAGRALGSFGTFATQSFHATKNIQCGEGGALVINDPEYHERAEVIREKGTNRSQFARGEIDKYHWMDVGSSYLPSDLLAAMLSAQLAEFQNIQDRRDAVWRAYDSQLADWLESTGSARQNVPDACVHPSHVYALLMASGGVRDDFIRHLRSRDIYAMFHYVPLDSAPQGLASSRTGPGGCPTSAEVSSRLVRLPLYADLSADDVDRVVAAVLSFRPRPD
jgi:dTDP-4-amino-4,6-dideoxygalactose transaminase